MKKFLLLLSVFALFAQGIDAKVVTVDQAMATARQFTASSRMFNAAGATNMHLGHVGRNLKGMSDYYVFNRDGGQGFVIVAGDDMSTPILAYSDKGSFDMNTVPETMKLMLDEYQKYVEWLRNNPQGAQDTRITYDLQPYGVYPICGEVHWHQFPPYNNNVPKSSHALTSNGRCYAGCVPVAFSTIMKGLKYPSRGSGENSYSFMLDGNEVTVSAKFNDYTYNYSNMRNGYGENASNAQAVSELVYEVGVAFNTIYSGESSDALLRNVFKGIVAYFNFNPDIQYVQKSSYYNAQDWYDMMYNEIDNGRPIYYMGYRTIDNSGNACNIGHAFVLDGYDSNGKVHVNWGFQPEAYNTYFDWELLSPRSDYDYDPYASGFNAKQAAIIGICPDTTDIGGPVVKAVNLVQETMPANDVRATIDVQALSGKWSGTLRYGIVSKSNDTYTTVYSNTTTVELEDNGIATIDLSGAYSSLREGQTYYIVVWTPYFSNSYEWMWFLNDPVPFTVGDWVTPPDPQFLLGDVNNDNEVNIADVTTLIDYLLNNSIEINMDAANVFEDEEINIADVTALIDLLLQPAE